MLAWRPMSVRVARALLPVIAMLALVLCAPERVHAETPFEAALHADHDVRAASRCSGTDTHAVTISAARRELPALVGTDAPRTATILPVRGEAVTLLAAAPRQRPDDVLAPRAPPRA